MLEASRRALAHIAVGRLRPLGALVYWAIMRMAVAAIRRGDRTVAAYVRGSLASGDAQFGLSDVDVVLVVADGPRAASLQAVLRARNAALRARVPQLGRLVTVAVYDQAALRAAETATCFTEEGPGVFFGSRASEDALFLRVRPGLYGAGEGWRAVGLRTQRRSVSAPDGQLRRLAAWLELQFWWRQAFRSCLEPELPTTAYLCAKLVAEPTRIWLWLVHRERPESRRAVLQLAARRQPDQDILRKALEILNKPAGQVEPPIAESLAWMARLSSAIAARLAEEVGEHGVTEVALVDCPSGELIVSGEEHGDGVQAVTPFLDWRAVAVPRLPDERVALFPGPPSDPDAIARAATAGGLGIQAALRGDGVLVLPSRRYWEDGYLRAIHCPLTDPVSFALADGKRVARFPNVAGWSAGDVAGRAVAEHRAWLEAWPGGPPATVRALGLLLSAARAELFRRSVASGAPELLLSVAGVPERLAGAGSGAAADGLEAYREGRLTGQTPHPSTVAALTGVVRDLPPYG